MKVELLKVDKEDIKGGDLIITADGDYRLICSNDNMYFGLDPFNCRVTSDMYHSLNGLLKIYSVARVIPASKLKLVEF